MYTVFRYFHPPGGSELLSIVDSFSPLESSCNACREIASTRTGEVEDWQSSFQQSSTRQVVLLDYQSYLSVE